MEKYEFINPFWEPIIKEVQAIFINIVDNFSLKENIITEEEYAFLLTYFTFYIMQEPFNIFNITEFTPDNMIECKNSIINYIKSLPKKSIFKSEIEIIIFYMFIITEKIRALSHKILDYYHSNIYSFLIENKYFNDMEVAIKFEAMVNQRYNEYFELLRKWQAGEKNTAFLKVYKNIFMNEEDNLENLGNSLILAVHYISTNKFINAQILPKYRIKGLKKYFIVKNGQTYLVNEEED